MLEHTFVRTGVIARGDVQSVLKVTISTLFKINSLWMDKSVSRCNSITFCSFPIFVRILPQNDRRHVICHSERAILNSETQQTPRQPCAEPNLRVFSRELRKHQKAFVFIGNRGFTPCKLLKLLSIETATFNTDCTSTPIPVDQGKHML